MISIVKTVVEQIEYAYWWLIDVLWDELIKGKKDQDETVVLVAFILFIILAVCSYYLQLFVDIVTFIGVVSLVLSQFSKVKSKQYHHVKTVTDTSTSRGIATSYFHEFCMILFLLFVSNFMPKAGHFIMFWLGPILGVQVPTLMLDLSLSGIWSVFEIEIEVLDYIDLSLLLISFTYSMFCWYVAKPKIRR